MNKKLAILLVIVIAVSMLAGCTTNSGNESSTGGNATEKNNNAEEKITLRIYAQYFDDDTKVPYDYAVEELKKAYPNVKLELEPQAQDDGQKLMTLAATGNLPDIYQVGLAQIENFKKSGNIMILNEVAEKQVLLTRFMKVQKTFFITKTVIFMHFRMQATNMFCGITTRHCLNSTR